jgi:hypothetical protein
MDCIKETKYKTFPEKVIKEESKADWDLISI